MSKMVKIYCYWEKMDLPSYLLSSNIDGIAFHLPASMLLSATGSLDYSKIGELKDAIKQCKNATKPKGVTLAFAGGNKWGATYIKQNHKYLKFVKKHGQNPLNDPIQLTIPMPYETKYIDKVEEIFSALAYKLKEDTEVWDTIECMKVTGANEESNEICFTGADYTMATTLIGAYQDGAVKWKDADYTCEKAVDCCNQFIDIFSANFNGKTIIQPYKPKLNSFPCVDLNGQICSDKFRPDLKEDVISYGMTKPNFKAQYTAFSLTAVIPSHSKYIQLNRAQLGHGKQSLEYFTEVMDLAKQYEYLEIFQDNVLKYPTLFQ